MHHLKILLIALLFAPLWPCTAFAEPQPYTLDGSHTHIIWKVKRFEFTNTVGSFTDISGTLLLDEDNPAASSVTANISLAGLRSDHLEREDIIRGDHWLDAENHPTITFTSTQVDVLPTKEGVQAAHVTGDLTLKNVTVPITMKVTLNKIGIEPASRKKAIGFTATGSFMREDFGVNTALKFIGNEVSFEIEALATLRD